MPTFLFLSTCCLNLDTITHVKFGEAINDDPYCDVFFAGAKLPQRFEGDDMKKLVEFMKSHKAQ